MNRIDQIAESARKLGMFLVQAYLVYQAFRRPTQIYVEPVANFVVTDPDCEVEYAA